jgi:DNA-binding SARP family transcriptional activator
MIHCRLLGAPSVTVNGEPAPPELLWRKNFALLVYLARSPKGARTREHLIGLLWADKPEGAARQSLREAIRVVRRALGKDGLRTEHDQVMVAPDAVRLDVDNLEELARSGRRAGAAALVSGLFLEGFSVPGAQGFEEWLTTEREHWRRRCVEILVGHAESRLAAGDTPEARAAAIRALDLDATSEPAARVAMQSLALGGDRAAALAAFSDLERRLADLGTRPHPDTLRLAERVREERAWRLPVGVPTASNAGAELRRLPLAGRERELTALLNEWRAVTASRRPAIVIVESDVGLGRSRLVEELVARARLDGAAVAVARAVESDREQPGAGLLLVARGGLLAAPGVAAAPPNALATLVTQIPEWAERFPRATGTPEPLPAAVSSVIRVAAEEQPLLVVMDDAEWCDHESLAAIAALARDAAGLPVCIVLASRAHAERAELDEIRSRLGRDVAGTTLHLTPLQRDDLRRLAAWAIPSYDEGQVNRLARRVLEDSAGAPLLAVEILHAVALGLDLGAIQGTWPEPTRTLAHTMPGDLPDAVVAAMRIGYRRLSPDTQKVLAACAVLETPVRPSRLAAATGLDAPAVEQALDELEWQRWLLADARGYSFVARIVREVIARDMVTPGQRARIQERGGPRD